MLGSCTLVSIMLVHWCWEVLELCKLLSEFRLCSTYVCVCVYSSLVMLANWHYAVEHCRQTGTEEKSAIWHLVNWHVPSQSHTNAQTLERRRSKSHKYMYRKPSLMFFFFKFYHQLWLVHIFTHLPLSCETMIPTYQI